MINFVKHRFENGVRAVLVPLQGLNSVTIEVFVKIGSKYERSNVFGISHYLEHMAFKGTTKRPCANDIHKEMDAKGASHNAGTGHELTSYYIKTVQENIPWAVELLSDILLHPTFPQAEFDKEKGVIIEEIKMYEDNPTMGLSSDFMDLLYKNTGVGCWNIAGSVESVGEITRQDLVSYRDKYLNPREMVVVVSGNTGDAFMQQRILDEIGERFGGLRGSDDVLPEVAMLLNETKCANKTKDIEQAHYCLGVPTIGWKDERKYVSRLVDVILCGNSSSRIFDLIREKYGLAYYIYSTSDLFEEAGFNGVQAGVAMEKLDLAIELTKKEYLGFASTVTEDELQRAKDYLVGKAKLNMDRTDFWSDFVGQRMLFENKLSGLEDEIAKYRAVELGQVVQFAQDFFVEENFRLMTVRRKK